jgi:hypothetical protein
MSRINSFTDTIGVRSPQSFCGDGNAGGEDTVDGDGDGFEDEQAHIEIATASTAIHSPIPRSPDRRFI